MNKQGATITQVVISEEKKINPTSTPTLTPTPTPTPTTTFTAILSNIKNETAVKVESIIASTHNTTPLTINPTLINSTSNLSISTPTLLTTASTPFITQDDNNAHTSTSSSSSSFSTTTGTVPPPSSNVALTTPHNIHTPLSMNTSMPDTPSTTLESINNNFSPKSLSQWTTEEDELLRQAVQQNAGKNFKKIGQYRETTSLCFLHVINLLHSMSITNEYAHYHLSGLVITLSCFLVSF
jgi:hypothetical protein